MRSPITVIAVAAIIIIALTTGITATAKKKGAYIGSESCAMCHSDTHPSIVEAHGKTLHAGAMADAVKNPKAVVAVFDAGAPFKKTQVKYVLGVGRSYQNFLDKDLKLLPGKWDAVAKKWEKIESVDGAKECVGCHVTNFDPQAKTWTEMGVGCESCHGPGEAHSESMEAKDIINLGKLDSHKVNMVCGQCHATGRDTSGKYAFPTTFIPGDELAEHFKLTEPKPGAANAQFNQFVESKHGKGEMKCSTCHDTHGDKTKAAHQLRSPINEGCLSCHSLKLGETEAVKDLKTHAPDAAPTDDCATCHMQQGSHKFEKCEKK